MRISDPTEAVIPHPTICLRLGSCWIASCIVTAVRRHPEMQLFRNTCNSPIGYACLTDCSFCGADLRSAHLQSADLTNANLEGANLEGANLKGGLPSFICWNCLFLFQGAKLSNANLKGANLQRAYLRHVNLRETKLEGARLDGANLLGAIR
ncbi:hypothetical protein C3L33_02363, partial [Rhododendron williamsianum]